MNANYWKLHKTIFESELDKLDTEAARTIMNEPDGEEAAAFNRLVREKTEAQAFAVSAK